MSNSLQPHGLQHTSLPCPSVSPGVCSNSFPLNQWRYPHISSSVIPSSSSPWSFLASGSFPVSQLFASSDRSIGASAAASVLPVNREWQTTPVFLPWEPHEQYEKKTYRLPKSTWKDAQHCQLLETCKSKLQWGIILLRSECTSSKSLKLINAEEGVEKRKLSYTVGENVNWFRHYGE